MPPTGHTSEDAGSGHGNVERRDLPESIVDEAAPNAHLEEVEAQLRDVQDRYVRLAADFDNFRKRAQQGLRDTTRYASAVLAERLLPVLDDAEQALEQVPEGTDERWLHGVRLTSQKLRDALTSAGVEPIEAVGAPFDPRLHEAIGSEDTTEQPEGTVARELRRGYRIHDRVLRPALVKVARHPDGG